MRALICGISGQDGAYLTQLLLEKGYDVVGTSRDAHTSSFSSLRKLGLLDKIRLTSMAPNDFRSVISTLKEHAVDEIYNLAGQSSVGLSFSQPAETMESIATGTLNLLEAIRFVDKPIKFYNAGSGECFGNTGRDAADEATPFSPTSPYAVAKVTAHNLVSTYRNAYGLFACTGILFNHESPLRPERFVTQKIIRTAVKIAAGSDMRLRLGNIDIIRDWGWAPEYVDAMYRMLQQAKPADYVIASGRSYSLRELIAEAFLCCGLDWTSHVDIDPVLLRPADHLVARANPKRAADIIGWSAKLAMPQVVCAMVNEAKKEL